MNPNMRSFVGALGLGAVLIQLCWVAPSFADGTERHVPFLTLRNPAEPDGPGTVFGDERSDLRAGWCMVEDAGTGDLEPIANAVPTFMREQFLRVDNVRVLDPADLLDDLQDGASAPPALYVHGYYIDFEKGCRRASLLQENAGLNGRLLWFSWPSDGDIANYPSDEADLYWSVPDLADTIIELDRRSGAAGEIDVLGHSLGARGVVLALHEVAHRKPEIRLGEVVLLAPDMDFGIFAKLLPHISQIAGSITVYVSEDDRPLALAEQLHGYSRLGQAENDFAMLTGVEVIDLSGLPTDTPSGHLYHLHSPHVGEDLNALLNSGLRASQRAHSAKTGSNTWVLRP